MEADGLLASVGGGGGTLFLRWPRSTNPSTQRPQIPPLYCLIRSLHCKIPSLDAPDSFTPLQHSFIRRPQFPSLHCQIPSLDAPRFLHSTAIFLYSTPPRFLYSTAKFLHFTPLRVSLSSVCPASAESRNCHLTVTRVTHYARALVY